MARYETTVTEGTIYVQTELDVIEVGDVEAVVEFLGGPAWEISYTQWEKEHYTHLDTADEGLTIDVVDAMHAMTFDESFVECLKAQPTEAPSAEAMSPRLGLFLGRLLENLEYGVR